VADDNACSPAARSRTTVAGEMEDGGSEIPQGLIIGRCRASSPSSLVVQKKTKFDLVFVF
jgi:hypothetical protein